MHTCINGRGIVAVGSGWENCEMIGGRERGKRGRPVLRLGVNRMDTLVLPPAKTVFETHYCPTCLRTLHTQPDSLICPSCSNTKPKSQSRLKRIVQCLCKAHPTEQEDSDIKERMLEDLSPMGGGISGEKVRKEMMMGEERELERRWTKEEGQGRVQCCALCGLGGGEEGEAVDGQEDIDSIPLPVTHLWECPCGTLTSGESHICQECGRTNRSLQLRHVSRRLIRSLDAGLEVITVAALLFAGVCRVCGDPTQFGSTVCSDCRRDASD